ALRRVDQVGRRGERSRQVDGDRVDLGVQDAVHEALERLPRVAVVRDRCLDLDEVALQAVPGELAEQVLLARVPAVQRADAHTGPCRNRRDGRIRIRNEDLAGSLEGADVVPQRLLPAAAQTRPWRVFHMDSIAEICQNGTEQFIPFYERKG